MTQNIADIHADIAALLPRLRRFGRAVTRNKEDADDLVQVAVERALLHTGQWEPGTRLDSWLFRIMKNAWIDEVRGRARRGQVLAPAEAGEHVGSDPSEAYVHRLAVQQAVGMLHEDHRLVVGLVLIDGMSYKDAAQVLEIPVGTLTSRLARARESLQALLSEAGAMTRMKQ
ncbi:RNA polymerase sigma factor [Undibacterium oligocarboniphilum]|uniref:Sigma-70 family RNA polymerase sigma factor n=1 Tax=Undibacterium oligocarboniphilum TaxID=666702 RepID=A0A850QF79_9BURK|nr:sigma-70 family RNA polymerase sigma factor [Undibacterium oligocarboniphilum]MBC3869590.1 sigma-70 family RNA polymerase sigma factor [Undibacterium oligocarboniphilum]NVO77968.1 sigma-70 family RNA polymerase sigma factor [Undibacterium oligocarboniphilum]